jgi:transaldolase
MEKYWHKYSDNKFPIKIFADGPTLNEIESFDKSIIQGYTFNPSLFRKLNVTDYLGHCGKILGLCGDMPVSLEVIADEQDEMVKQARKLGELDKKVYVKIPISYTSGESTLNVIKTLVNDGINLNITAVFTKKQVETILPCLSKTESIISIFSGRLFDLGLNAVEITGKIAEIIHEQSNCKILWASPRMVYDIINACDANCDVIIMQSSLIKKLLLFKKSPEEYSIDTVKMFYRDAVESGYKM